MTQIQDVVSSAFQLLNDHEISEDSTYLLAKKIDQLTKEELDCKIEHIGPYPYIYTEIVEDRQLQISIFYIKKGYHLPLHDHPGMYGIIKVLFGQIRVEGYSVCEDNVADPELTPEEHFTIPCKRSSDIILEAESKPICLTPTVNNIHKVVAKKDCAFFDCLIPPYENNCHFYSVLKSLDHQQKIYELLCTGSHPENSYHTVRRRYTGEQFSCKSSAKDEITKVIE